MRRHAAVVGVWLCCLAAADAEAAKRVALLIGNEQYQFHSPLSNPKRDVELVASHLRKLGFTVVSKANLKRTDMIAAIDQFIDDADGAEVALFYYAGHGMQPLDGGRNYLLPVDARRVPAGNKGDSVLRADAVPADGADGVLRRLERTKTRLRLLLLDACRNNQKGLDSTRGGDRGLKSVMPEDQFTLVSFSTRESALALDDVKGSINSPYAAALAKWLPMAGHRAVRDIFEEVGEQVKRDTDGDQEPAVYTTLPGNIMLSGSKRERTEAENEADAWFYASQAGSVSALKAFLQEYPKGQYAPQARIRLAAPQESPPPSPQKEPASPPPISPQKEPASPPPISPQIGQTIKDCADCPELVLLPKGSFVMGSPDNEKDRGNNEGPTRTVNISKAIAVGRYEVTRAEFGRFVADSQYKTEAERGNGCEALSVSAWKYDAAKNWRDPGFKQGEDHPVVCVSWNDTQEYLKWLNKKAPGKNFRLLSEAEWEYAARAGKGGTRFPWGDDLDYTKMCAFSNGADETVKGQVPGAWSWAISKCSDGYAYTAPVTALNPNAFGLMHMHGNAWEWVQDVWHDNYTGAPTDGTAWEAVGDSARRVLRGGSWLGFPRSLRSALRYENAPDDRGNYTGFRIARTFSL